MKQLILLSLTDNNKICNVYTDVDLKIDDYVAIIRKKENSELLDIIGGRVIGLNHAWAKSSPRITDIVQKIDIEEYEKNYQKLELNRKQYESIYM